MRVIIADDSRVLRERLVASLSEIESVTVVGEEESAPRVVEAVKNLRPDLVIMDIKMAGGDGIEALKHIKKEAHPPVVAMFTNHPYLQYRKRCFDAGADFFLYKPNEFPRLLDVVKKLSKALRPKKG
jgi:DNA-binding NarL/FixJ family response regulator